MSQQQATDPASSKTLIRSVRFRSAEQLRVVKRKAEEQGVSLSAFMLAAVLGASGALKTERDRYKKRLSGMEKVGKAAAAAIG